MGAGEGLPRGGRGSKNTHQPDFDTPCLNDRILNALRPVQVRYGKLNEGLLDEGPMDILTTRLRPDDAPLPSET